MAQARFMRTSGVELAAGFVGGLLQGYLASGKRVVWLVSGGSTIPLAVLAHQLVDPELLTHLTLMQIDERYGPVGHADSNWQQLGSAGLVIPAGETAVPILTGAPLAETVECYSDALMKQLDQADVRIGLFGMGADGHTAGILPHSPALNEDGLVASYTADDFQRITITGAAIARLDEAILYAIGASKQPQLQRLQIEQPASDQPAQLLKQTGRLLVINDTIGDAVSVRR